MDSFSDTELLCDLLEASMKRNVSVHLLLDHHNLNLFVSMWQELKLNSKRFPVSIFIFTILVTQTYCASKAWGLLLFFLQHSATTKCLPLQAWNKQLISIRSFLCCVYRSCLYGVSMDWRTVPRRAESWRVRLQSISSSVTGRRCWLVHTGMSAFVLSPGRKNQVDTTSDKQQCLTLSHYLLKKD